METRKIELEVPKEICELAQGLGNLVKVAVAELKDNGGWSTIDDLPAIGMAVVALLPALDGIAKVGVEFKEMPAESIAALVIEIAKAL